MYKKSYRYFVYILASKYNGVIYVGVTNSLFRRVFQHQLKSNNGSFSSKYNVTRLVYYESFSCVRDAICREKQIKKWNRSWKVRLIEKDNPKWENLFEG